MPERATEEHLDPGAHALVLRWASELASEPEATVRVFRFLLAMVAVRRQILREVGRGERDGRHLVMLVHAQDEAFYWVDDPRLGEERERIALDGILEALAASE